MKEQEKSPKLWKKYLAIWSVPLIILLIGILFFGHWKSHPAINIPEKVIDFLFLANFPFLVVLSMRIKKYVPLIIVNAILQIIVTLIITLIAEMMVNGMMP